MSSFACRINLILNSNDFRMKPPNEWKEEHIVQEYQGSKK
jgi:hypothetical protein